MAEWLKAPDSKSGVGVTLPEVRILSLSPIVFTREERVLRFPPVGPDFQGMAIGSLQGHMLRRASLPRIVASQ